MLTSTAIALTLCFLAVAILYSSVGHGGASGYLAAMTLLAIDTPLMRPVALSLNVLVASIATAQFLRAGHFRWALFWPFALASVPAAALGGAITLPAHIYRPIIGAVLLFSAWRLAATSWKPRQAPDPSDCNVAAAMDAAPPHRAVALGVGAALGLLSGLTGTGGGIFLSPLLLLTGWADAKKTAAVSGAFILFNSVAGLIGYFTKHTPPDGLFPWIGPWTAVAIVGGSIGSYFGAQRLPSPTLKRLLAAVLLVAGVKLIAL